MATITSGLQSYLLDEVTSAVFINEFAQLPNTMGMLYTMRGSSSRRERSSSIGGLGQFNTKTEAAPATEDSPIQQFQKTFNHTAYAKTVQVSRELIDDEDWGWFENLGMQLAASANRTMETLAAGVFNDAFAGATYTAEDGLSLCNNAHLNADSGNSQDNLLTTALSFAALNSARIAHRKITDYRGEKISVNPDLLLVPVDLEATSWELVRGSVKSGDSNDLENFFSRVAMNLVVWNYLTDTNDWFLIDSNMMRLNLLWYMRTGLEVYGDGDLFSGTRRIGAYFRSSHGPVDWRWVMGSQVA